MLTGKVTNYRRWNRTMRIIRIIFIVALLLQVPGFANDTSTVTFESKPGSVQIQIGDAPFAKYVYNDSEIPRPYFCDVHAPGGTQVTRNHPPIEGIDKTDHETYHPGIWLAFGDINGADFWRNKARVDHERFVEEPQGSEGIGVFAVENRYSSNGETICREICKYDLIVVTADLLGGEGLPRTGFLLIHESEFFPDTSDFVFGDQEEMGLGVRLATPITVKNGGSIQNSEGLKNEEGVWGKQAAWCEYSGIIGDRRVGVVLMPHPGNFRESWFHARDYGLLLANPFGRNAFTEGEKSAVPVKKEERFPLRFGVFVYSAEPEAEDLPLLGYREYLSQIEQ